MADSTNDLTYTPTTWADGADGGTAITAARLNNIESGVTNATKQANANAESIKTLGDSVSHCAKSLRGQLLDISFQSLSTLDPGCYVVGDGSSSVVGNPSTTSNIGWIVVFQATEHRVAALLVLGQGSSTAVYVTSGIDADNWVKVK